MNINEARAIGSEKLKIDAQLFEKCLEAAKRMEVDTKDLAPMTLALAILGVSKAQETSIGLENELRDALNIVSQAEREWRFQIKLGGKARLS